MIKKESFKERVKSVVLNLVSFFCIFFVRYIILSYKAILMIEGRECCMNKASNDKKKSRRALQSNSERRKKNESSYIKHEGNSSNEENNIKPTPRDIYSIKNKKNLRSIKKKSNLTFYNCNIIKKYLSSRP